jgi:hypothetical protein
MKILIQPQAVSWTKRAVKVAGKWAEIAPSVNLLKIRVGEDQWMEVVTTLDGKKSIERVY